MHHEQDRLGTVFNLTPERLCARRKVRLAIECATVPLCVCVMAQLHTCTVQCLITFACFASDEKILFLKNAHLPSRHAAQRRHASTQHTAHTHARALAYAHEIPLAGPSRRGRRSESPTSTRTPSTISTSWSRATSTSSQHHAAVCTHVRDMHVGMPSTLTNPRSRGTRTHTRIPRAQRPHACMHASGYG